ncbi:MAG TPA: maleylacetoacetate isomerase [Candidatus Cybelea sp.]|nr:maleylacetoacetate isomerase [Candidatus Cybelea sp.]
MKLYGYFRSSAAYRVRIALNLKGIPYDNEFVHLRRGGGEQFKPEYRKLNPLAIVPSLEDGHAILTQSLAIIEYLEEARPEPALLPKNAVERARVRALALSVACEIHPLNNLRTLNYLQSEFKLGEPERDRWYKHWIKLGLEGIEAMLAGHPLTGTYCHGEKPTVADVCLVPQVGNARRFNCDLSGYPTIVRIEQACLKLDAFKRASPENQPDKE